MVPEDRSRALNSSVLVLNRHYSAVRVITTRHAFVLMFREVAEVIDIEDGQFNNFDWESWCEMSQMRMAERQPHDDWVRAVNFDVLVPRIVRLTKFDRQHCTSLRLNRRNLFARDDHRCQYCGLVLPTNQLSFDHVVPRSHGGETSWDNLVASCIKCNTKKGGRTPQQARMKLLRTPARPTHNPLLAVKLGNPKYESWKSFLPKGSMLVDVG